MERNYSQVELYGFCDKLVISSAFAVKVDDSSVEEEEVASPDFLCSVLRGVSI